MTTKTTVILDWRELAEAPEPHFCDCSYCEMEGELEEIDWPTLVTTKRGDVEYVTDRYMMVRAERAPVPDDYEGSALPGPVDLGDRWQELPTDRPADDLTFRRSIRLALSLTKWRLVHLDHAADASVITRKRVGVLDERGEHIGWAIASKEVD